MKTAEEYLTETDHDGEVTDVESVVTEKSNTESELSSNYGKLKHSDSLLLLTQVRFFVVVILCIDTVILLPNIVINCLVFKNSNNILL